MITTDAVITKIRYRDKDKCVCYCHPVSAVTKQIDRAKGFSATFLAALVHPESFERGQIWYISGKSESKERAVRTAAGYLIYETHIPVQAASIKIASGMQIQTWLKINIKGIGDVLAGKLYREYPNELLAILNNADDDKVAKIITNPDTREELFEQWQKNGDAETLKFMQEKQIPVHLAQKAIKYHKKNTLIKLKEDPYRLLSFSGSWKEVDAIARTKFELPLDDRRRLAAALEEALYSCHANGHTCLPFKEAYNEAKKLIAPYKQTVQAFEDAIEQGQKNGQFIQFGNDEKWLSPVGPYLMEKQTAIFIKQLLSEQPNQQELFEISPEAVLREFELTEGMQLCRNFIWQKNIDRDGYERSTWSEFNKGE
jgi:exodeoxyribonuclease V alpha subunit